MPKFVKYFLTVTVFVLGVSVGTYLGYDKEVKQIKQEKEIVPVQDVVIRNVQSETEKENPIVLETFEEETKLSPYAKMIIEKKYNKCGHTTVDIKDIPMELINMTKEEIMAKYPDWEIRSFSSTEVSMYREIEANCNDHFVLKDKNGFIAIYKNIADNIIDLQEVTDIDISTLPEEDATYLKDGIYVYGQDALSSLIENYSS